MQVSGVTLYWKISVTFHCLSNPWLQDIIRSKASTQPVCAGFSSFPKKYHNLKSRKSPVSSCETLQNEIRLWLWKEEKAGKALTPCSREIPVISVIEALILPKSYNYYFLYKVVCLLKQCFWEMQHYHPRYEFALVESDMPLWNSIQQLIPPEWALLCWVFFFFFF